jgi:hypothetical protein
LLHSGEVSSSAEIKEIKDKIQTIPAEGKTADFPGALTELMPRLSQTPESRMAYTVLVTSSAGGITDAVTGSTQSMLKWFRSEKYERWQALILAPDINQKVNQAAVAYMASTRQ